MSRALAASLVAAALALPAAGRAASPTDESPRWGSFELAAGTYRPDIDSDFPVGQGPFELVFGGGRDWVFKVHAAKALYVGWGSLEVGAGAGYFQAEGNARFQDGTVSPEKTRLRFFPIRATLTYRADFLERKLKVPLAPYVRGELTRYVWSVSGEGSASGQDGATDGWAVTGGLALLLDVFDPGLAREMDRDSGVNSTYLFFEVTKSRVDDFGSGTSWDLSDEKLSLTGGLLFAF